MAVTLQHAGYQKSMDDIYPEMKSRIFWGTVVSKNLTVRGADASNAFVEAKVPDIPLYVRVNTQYRE